MTQQNTSDHEAIVKAGGMDVVVQMIGGGDETVSVRLLPVRQYPRFVEIQAPPAAVDVGFLKKFEIKRSV